MFLHFTYFISLSLIVTRRKHAYIQYTFPQKQIRALHLQQGVSEVNLHNVSTCPSFSVINPESRR
jgi:hypothetical protein